MIVRVAEQSAQSGAASVTVAADDERIVQAVRSAGFQAVMTDVNHISGTDRLHEAVKLLNLDDDAIIVNAQNPTAFGPVIKRAKEAGVILIAFDNILDTEDAINVDVDQKGLGVLWANWIIKYCDVYLYSHRE